MSAAASPAADHPRPRGPFPAFALLYALLYGAFGAESPFLPAFLGERGLSPGEIGVALAAGTLVRIAAGPLAGRLADGLDAPRMVLGVCAAAAGAVSFAYLAGRGFAPLLLVGMVHAVAIAPLAPLADAIALAAVARSRGGFSYGWVRGVGSGAFILGTLASGELVARAGLSSIVASSALLFVGAALVTGVLPGTSAPREAWRAPGGVRRLLALAPYRRLLVVGALVLGSHALSDAFAVIHWREAGIPPAATGALWSTAVAAEVVVFLLVGGPLLRRLGAARAAGLAALAGIVRWSAMALTAAIPVLVAAQLLHGLTFALFHLAAMRVIAREVDPRLAATAQTLYGTFALGIASAALTALSGWLYAGLGAGAFWVMAGLSLLALPLVPGLREADAPPAEEPAAPTERTR